MLRLYLLRDPLRRLGLFVAVREDCGAVLRSSVSTLAIHGRRIVRAVEKFCVQISMIFWSPASGRDEATLTDQLSVRYLAGIKLDSHSFGMVRSTAAHLLIRRVLDERVAASIAHGGGEDALVLLRRVVLHEDVLDAPEASRGECCDFSLS